MKTIKGKIKNEALFYKWLRHYLKEHDYCFVSGKNFKLKLNDTN